MAQQKWIKWVVGLSGVALFTGFVGLISAQGETPPEAPADTTTGSFAQNDDQVTNQWQSQTDAGQPGGFGRRGAIRSGDTGSDSGTSGQSETGGQGSMRTHAS
ncbi:hypothetical protein [Cohnella sp. JJ-181]|uniref:hypothetical protein n=1 Tax=Cohnella rhizoplanae TaxID=2974897 RepID=UPI0022FF76A3|nr:hypothetical protein [Cohnella sp. JJ-181]CAI6080603.1 hypothetical protein COHCIP112018_03039 [Cohnella sp. JJ-181]